MQNPDIRPIFGKPARTPGRGSKKRTCPGKPGRMVTLGKSESHFVSVMPDRRVKSTKVLTKTGLLNMRVYYSKLRPKSRCLVEYIPGDAYKLELTFANLFMYGVNMCVCV